MTKKGNQRIDINERRNEQRQTKNRNCHSDSSWRTMVTRESEVLPIPLPLPVPQEIERAQ